VTERKPKGMSVETWIEKQIRQAEERGQFENLPGAGKPIPGRGQPDGELWWLKGYMAREKLDFVLPASLRLRKEIEDLPDRVDRERREYAVRHVVDDLNERIGQENRWPTPGPPLNRMPVDVEVVVAEWHQRRAAREPVLAPVPEPSAPPARRRWWSRRESDAR